MALSDSKPLVALVLLGLLVIGVYRFRSKSAVEVNLPNVDDQSLFVDVAGVETPAASEEQQQPAAPTVPPPTFKPLELIRPPEMLKTNLDLQSPDMRAACSLPYFSLVGKEASFSPDAHRLIASHVIVTPGVTAPRDFPPHELSQQLLAGLDCSFNVSTWSKLLYPPLKELLQFLAAQRAPNSSIEQHIRNTLNAQECKFGQITPTGLVQNMLVGKYLAHLFVEKSGLLTQNESAKVFIRAVNEQPTFVAAIATAFGFFLRGKLDLKYLKVRPVNDSFLCAERWNMTCACGPADDMREDVWAGVDRGFQQFNPPDAFRADYARWAIMLDKLNVQPHEFFPQFHNAMAHHCAQVDFPCLAHGAAEAKNESETKRCLPFTPVDYRVGFDAYQFLNKDLNNNRFLLASDTLKVYPYLLELIARLDTAEQRRRNNSDDYLKVSLTFAQPEFVTALKRALGVNVDGRMTGFASRFSFELYETIKRNPGEVLIRIVENGQPLTMAATKVCDKTYQTMCQLQRFRESLVTRLMLENVGISDYKRACKRAPARPKKTIEHDSL